ncbi:MAG: SMC-Scp complex subunit ScpB [Deltaproteobacteria bacterium]|nr:SMC-Scp complex subunit ScpB [Deltaproteobacteria bacterium]
MEDASLTQIIEALLFSSNRALTVKEISKVTGTEDRSLILNAINELNEFYDLNERAFFIQNIAGGFQLRTDIKFKSWIQKSKTVKPLQLSTSLMETLSIIAYQQPITRAEIESIRSVDSSYAVKSLLDKKLIRISGKKDLPGRPLIYATSSLFLEYFGIKNLKELPLLEDIDFLNDSDQVTPIEIVEE